MPVARSQDEKRFFNRLFASELRKALKELKLNQQAASQELGITRATLYAWLHESATPDGMLLAKVMVKFEMQLDCFEGRLVGKGLGRRVAIHEPTQGTLFLK